MAEHQSKQGGARVRIPPPLVFLTSIGLGVALRYLIAPPPLPFSRAVQLIAGAVLVAGALMLVASAFGLFKKSGQDPAPWKPAPSLVLSGPYRFTRNPMYVGMMTFQIGVGALLGNLWVVAGAALSLVAVHFIAVLPEEAYLEEKFGDGYRRFKQQVRRYL